MFEENARIRVNASLLSKSQIGNISRQHPETVTRETHVKVANTSSIKHKLYAIGTMCLEENLSKSTTSYRSKKHSAARNPCRWDSLPLSTS